jgi:hypothetical protein
MWWQAEIIPKILDVAALVGPPPIKIRVVGFAHCPWWPLHKKKCFDPSGHLKNGKCIFMWKLKKH